MRTMILSTAAILVMGIIVAGQDRQNERMLMLRSGTRMPVQLQGTVDISSSNTAISSPGGSSSNLLSMVGAAGESASADQRGM